MLDVMRPSVNMGISLTKVNRCGLIEIRRTAEGFVDWIEKTVMRLVWATGYSLAGLRAAFRHEQAFRQEVGVLIVIIPAALWLGKSGLERALLIGSWILVITVELINSAVESAVDRVGLERHELAGRAKDQGSAAVFCAIALAVVIWILVLAG
jgi:diacylglycerol kinase (ATP)